MFSVRGGRSQTSVTLMVRKAVNVPSSRRLAGEGERLAWLDADTPTRFPYSPPG
jgi:hypothetical protein